MPIKNKIITISGEPASGKSTVVKELKKNYEDSGIKVTVLSVGNMFREIAENSGISIGELNKQLNNKRSEIDKVIDDKIAKIGKKFNESEKKDEILIVDSRLAWSTIPESFSVRLTTNPNIAAERVFHDTRRGKEDKYKTLDEARISTDDRRRGEVERYKKRYGVDLEDVNNYNIVIDTSFSKVEEIAEVIENCLELENQGKFYGKTWTSPKTLLPLQDIRITGGRGTVCTYNELVELIKKNGYKYNEPIDVVEVDGMKFIIEGHHRNFASAGAEKTLVPYELVGKDDENIKHYSNTARQRVDSVLHNPNYIYCLNDHGSVFDKKDENGKILEMFSYNTIYPGIYDLCRKQNDNSGKGNGR